MPPSKELSRRDFFKVGGALAGSTVLGALAGCAAPAPAEAGPKTPTPIVKKPEPTAIPSSTPGSSAVPSPIAKPVEAAPKPEAGEITSVTIFDREYSIIDLDSDIGGGAEAIGIEAFKQAARISPFKIFHPVSKDELVAGLEVAGDGSKIVEIAKWTKELGWHMAGDEKSPLELFQPNQPKVKYRSKPVDSKNVELIAGMKLGTLVNEGTKIDIVAAVPGQKPIPALDESGVKHDWQPVFLREAEIDLGKLNPKKPDVTDQAVGWVADEYMEKIVEGIVYEVEGQEWFGGFNVDMQIKDKHYEMINSKESPSILLGEVMKVIVAQKNITVEQLNALVRKDPKIQIIIPQADPRTPSNFNVPLAKPVVTEIDLSKGIRITTSEDPSPGSKINIGVKWGNKENPFVWYSVGARDGQLTITFDKRNLEYSLENQKFPVALPADKVGITHGVALSNLLAWALEPLGHTAFLDRPEIDKGTYKDFQSGYFFNCWDSLKPKREVPSDKRLFGNTTAVLDKSQFFAYDKGSLVPSHSLFELK